MRLQAGFLFLLLGILLYLAPATGYGQVITEGPDSVLVEVPDTLTKKEGFFLANFKVSSLKDLDRPTKAALWAAAIPGAGQFYNKSYWKMPLVYAMGAVLGYYLIYNNNQYQSYRVALIKRIDGDSTTVDEYANHSTLGVQNGTEPGSFAVRNLEYRRDGYRRNRDLTILLSIGAYGLQIAEAYVHAHLKEFDVSDDLALRMQPNLIPVAGTPTGITPALTLTLYTRSK
ncbi:DUF5683 domain-containing protein [Pontibacter sp. E15-1]|uniref:DUF5683 domain-containing protein n=1 Tax=Pontibacter sp. E15-1 TaxID=2919918 RepID=UPI001F4F3BA9|nr:DUF5683 domain-containing protein [Pontibacter sp. E15-1]MCJ8167084.1 DUF5683 domain-containing protein [Pontibacter sp. E15-1]